VFEATGTPPAPTDPAGTSAPPDDTAGGETSDDDTGAVVVGAGCADVPDGYQLVWSDEFDVDGLPDTTHWGYETGGDGWGNNELQYYTEARPENVNISDGVLTITAIDETYQNNTYTSAKLNSSLGDGNPGAWNEGILRIRARLPAGLGTWPALWMMPNTCPEGWPNCGEIDIMEHVGYDEGTVHGTIHTDAFNHVEGTQNGKQVTVSDATSAFHDYTLIWTANRLQWMVDGEVYHTIDKEAGWGFAEWPFNEKEWHLKMNLAVGGSWGGAEGVDAADFPARFDIDHVCVYQTAE
jgi:beta-glucanase (GH16 family)